MLFGHILTVKQVSTSYSLNCGIIRSADHITCLRQRTSLKNG